MARWALIAIILSTCGSHAAAQPDAGWWKPLAFIVGEWGGEGSGKPGQGGGSFSLKPELDGSVLVRRSQSAYPAANGRPATVHEDLMVIYPEAGRIRADYWDNERHVIRYAVQVSPAGDRVTMLSDVDARAPRFRLTYISAGPDRLRVVFEIAPPGSPEKFAPYIEGTVRRKA